MESEARTWSEVYERGGYEGLLAACRNDVPYYIAFEDDMPGVAEYLAAEAANDCLAGADEERDDLFNRLYADVLEWAEGHAELVMAGAARIAAALGMKAA